MFRNLIGALCLIALSFLTSGPDTAAAQTPPPSIIRPSLPTNESPSGDFTTPANAWDGNEGTAAAGTWGRSCTAQCTGTTTKSTTWSGFPAGYRPKKLYVRRKISAILNGVYKPDLGQIKVRIEWSAGGQWNTLEELTATTVTNCAQNPEWCALTRTTDLPPDADSAAIQVRVTVEISFLLCDGCDGPSNILANVAVQEITVEADGPVTAPTRSSPICSGV